MKKTLLFFAVLLGFISLNAQDNPFAVLGYEPKIATLSNGQFNESFDNDTIVQIGSVLFNTKSKKIVAFVVTDTMYSEATLEPDIVSRWISPDPLADHPMQIGQSPYQYAWNNPVYWTDPDGRCPFCPWLDAVVDIGFVIYDVGEIAYDYATTGEVDPVSVAALTADVASIAIPMTVGGGLAVRAAAKTAKTINKVDNAADVAKTVDKASDATKATSKSDGARFVGDTDGKVIDTKTTPKGSYDQPDGTRTDVLQQKSHYDKNTKQNHGTSHTHEKYKNVDPKTGKVREGVSQKKTHRPTYEEVKNIETGKAKKR